MWTWTVETVHTSTAVRLTAARSLIDQHERRGKRPEKKCCQKLAWKPGPLPEMVADVHDDAGTGAATLLASAPELPTIFTLTFAIKVAWQTSSLPSSLLCILVGHDGSKAQTRSTAPALKRAWLELLGVTQVGMAGLENAQLRTTCLKMIHRFRRVYRECCFASFCNSVQAWVCRR
jgi:hypothetical protein